MEIFYIIKFMNFKIQLKSNWKQNNKNKMTYNQIIFKIPQKITNKKLRYQKMIEIIIPKIIL